VRQVVRLLVINKRIIVSSPQVREEVFPLLNGLQIKQLLSMYTPTDLEDTIPITSISKICSLRFDEQLLAEPSKVLPLSYQYLHYVTLDDINTIRFPQEVKKAIEQTHHNSLPENTTTGKERISTFFSSIWGKTHL